MYQLIINQEYDVPVTKLFTAWQKVELLKQWFAPGDMSVPEAFAEVVAGGHYRIVMQEADGSQHIVGGKYFEVVENEKLVFSWQWEGSPLATKVSLLFKSLSDNRSTLQLIHSEFADQESCDKHEMGWNGCLANLPKVL